MQIAAKRWRIDLNAAQQAALMLSAVNLPGGVQVRSACVLAAQTSNMTLMCSLVQRRRNAEDELNMRFVYEEGDLIAAEVQQLHADGSIVLHTRSHKYGKVCRLLLRLFLVPQADDMCAARSLRVGSW